MMTKKLRDIATGWSGSSTPELGIRLLKKLSLFLHKVLANDITQISGDNLIGMVAAGLMVLSMAKITQTTLPNGFEGT
jgi:hypothetical protein